ncbi:MAG: MaoC/PaaZ C-terminal domain-containing protein [Myxococcota bacterium]|nr:MaoC/PaaZ C-terminal domain-containing protein [Myxococcota bacterium]
MHIHHRHRNDDPVEGFYDSLRYVPGLLLPTRWRTPATASTHRMPIVGPRDCPIHLAHLKEYELITDGPKRNFLPPTYLQVVATPLHFELLARKDFPVCPLGLLHLYNEIELERPLPIEPGKLMAQALLSEVQAVRSGLLLGIQTLVTDEEGALVWKAHSVVLSPEQDPSNHALPLNKSGIIPPLPRLDESQTHQVSTRGLDKSLGRNYARITRDPNPIFQYTWTAKLMGLERTVIHGMWTQAWALNKLTANLFRPLTSVKAWFTNPIYLPSTLLLEAAPNRDGTMKARVMGEGDVDNRPAMLLEIES